MDTQTAPATSFHGTTLADLVTLVDALKREYPDSGLRAERAAQLVLFHTVEPSRSGAWYVASLSQPDREHIIMGGRCDCPDATKRETTCYHMMATLLVARLERLETDREQAPFLCDVCGAGVDYDQVSPDPDAPPLCARCLHVSLLPPPDADAPIALTLSDAAYAALAALGEPCAIEPVRPVGISALPYTPAQAAIAAELGMGPDCA